MPRGPKSCVYGLRAGEIYHDDPLDGDGTVGLISFAKRYTSMRDLRSSPPRSTKAAAPARNVS